MSRGGNFKHQYQQSKAKGVKTKPPNQTTNKHNGHHSIMSSLFHNLKSCYVGTAASASCNDIPSTWLKKKQSPNEHTDTEQQSSHGGTTTLTCLSNRKSINIVDNKEIVMTITGRYFKACFPVGTSERLYVVSLVALPRLLPCEMWETLSVGKTTGMQSNDRVWIHI